MTIAVDALNCKIIRSPNRLKKFNNRKNIKLIILEYSSFNSSVATKY